MKFAPLFLLSASLLLGTVSSLHAESRPKTKTILEPNILYKAGDSLTEYEKERCRLDLFIPADKKAFTTLIWFHGGGLTGGNKDGKTAQRLSESAGVAVVSVNYRLSPKATFPAYVEDAAAALAWVRQNIAQYGGDPTKVYAGGHSAGAYLVSLVSLDAQYLKKYGSKPEDFAGYIPVSGQTMTHFTVRVERGQNKDAIIADEAAPIYFARKGIHMPRTLILMGDKDWPARLEENQYYVAAMKVAGAKEASVLVVPDRDHGSIMSKLLQPNDPGFLAVLKFIHPPTAADPAQP